MEEQPLQSLVGKFQAFHTHIDEALFCGKSGANLIKENVFFPHIDI